MTAKQYGLYVFDWDGTVMDTTGLIARGIQQAAKTLGLKVPSLETARSVIGLGMADTMRIVNPDCPYERWDEYLQAYKSWYIKREAAVEVMAGLRELLEEMNSQGMRLAVATGKSRAGLNRVFALTGIEHLFEETITADESFSKPNPAMLFELSDRTGVEPDKMVMVGDTVHDLQLAQNAGAQAVGVTWGACARRDLEKLPHVAVVDTVEELRSLFLG